PVNVSTHTGSARSTPPIQGKCPELSLLQHPLGRVSKALFAMLIGGRIREAEVTRALNRIIEHVQRVWQGDFPQPAPVD
ncbi:hypothetical protein ACFZCF_17110, partial [Streptomyces sp. NPDC007945]|uniref:hypothetical protein n=1 Tax=Streptomyces sp. NPDC007945 TaxID=3364797 RepID=UPI0036E5458B